MKILTEIHNGQVITVNQKEYKVVGLSANEAKFASPLVITLQAKNAKADTYTVSPLVIQIGLPGAIIHDASLMGLEELEHGRS